MSLCKVRKTDTACHATWIWPTMKKRMQKGRKGGHTKPCQVSTVQGTALSQRERGDCTKNAHDVRSKTPKEKLSMLPTPLQTLKRFT